MESSNTDRRVRKTKALIRQTLTHMLMEKDLKDITVSDLTERADINRGTFYLHYKDIYDLFEQIEKEIWENFNAIIAKHKTNTRLSFLPILLELIKYVAANSDTFIAFMRTKETRFFDQFIEMSRPQSKQEWIQFLGNGQEEFYDYYYSFVSFGCVALLKRWFDNGMQETPECMAKLAEQLMVNSISNLG